MYFKIVNFTEYDARFYLYQINIRSIASTVGILPKNSDRVAQQSQLQLDEQKVIVGASLVKRGCKPTREDLLTRTCFYRPYV